MNADRRHEIISALIGVHPWLGFFSLHNVTKGEIYDLVTGYKLRYVAAVRGLLVFFFALMLRSYIQGQGIDCGCFGLGEAISPKTLLRDGSLLAAAVLLTVAAFMRRRQTAWPPINADERR
jgi:hypothetical protein